MSAKNMVDSGLGSGNCTNEEAAAALAQDHPKSGTPPVGFGMRSRAQDGDGPDDDARDQSFEKG